MKIINPILLIIILGIFLFLSRNLLFPLTFKYEVIANRSFNNKIEADLEKYIDDKIYRLTNKDINSVVVLALKLTAEKLGFTTQQCSNNPNEILITGKAHCVGYASFYSTICNELLKQKGLKNKWIAEPFVGKIYFMGINVHRYFNSSFLKNHDFIIIKNLETGEQITVDPVLYDYLKIKRIELKN